MRNNTKKCLNIISRVAVIIIVILTVLLLGAKLAGFKPFVVLSGSMEPAYHVGSLIYVKEMPADEIKVGDPITFVMDEQLNIATHRVVDIDNENQTFTTKGDANDYPDGNPVHFNNLIGKPVFSIPKAGYVVNFVQNPPGIYFATIFVALIMILAFLPDLADRKKTDENEPDNNRNKVS